MAADGRVHMLTPGELAVFLTMRPDDFDDEDILSLVHTANELAGRMLQAARHLTVARMALDGRVHDLERTDGETAEVVL